VGGEEAPFRQLDRHGKGGYNRCADLRAKGVVMGRTGTSRRTFLRSVALAGLGAALKDLLHPSPLATVLAGAPQQTGIVATPTDALRLRAGPGTEYATLAIVPRGEPLPVLARNGAGNWIEVRYGDRVGWVAAWFTTIAGDLFSAPVVESVAPAALTGPVAIPSDVLILRAGPGTGYAVLGRVPAGAALPVQGRSTDGAWLYVEHTGRRGWIAAWLCTLSGDLAGVPLLTAEGLPLDAPMVVASVAAPPIVSRAEWGARAVSAGYIPHTPQRITIHMDGAYFERDPIQRMQTLQAWSIDVRGWVDIPYHYVVDRDGVIYEGRPVQFVGDTGTNYDPSGHISIAAMGDFDIQAPSRAQIEAIIALAAWLSATYGVPPALIQGHRDYAYTTCPGEYFYFDYVQNGAIRRAVEERLRGGG